MGSAPAQVIVHGQDDVCLRGRGFFQQQTAGIHDHPRRTETALEGIMFDEGFLDGVKLPVPG